MGNACQVRLRAEQQRTACPRTDEAEMKGEAGAHSASARTATSAIGERAGRERAHWKVENTGDSNGKPM